MSWRPGCWWASKLFGWATATREKAKPSYKERDVQTELPAKPASAVRSTTTWKPMASTLQLRCKKHLKRKGSRQGNRLNKQPLHLHKSCGTDTNHTRRSKLVRKKGRVATSPAYHVRRRILMMMMMMMMMSQMKPAMAGVANTTPTTSNGRNPLGITPAISNMARATGRSKLKVRETGRSSKPKVKKHPHGNISPATLTVSCLARNHAQESTNMQVNQATKVEHMPGKPARKNVEEATLRSPPPQGEVQTDWILCSKALLPACGMEEATEEKPVHWAIKLDLILSLCLKATWDREAMRQLNTLTRRSLLSSTRNNVTNTSPDGAQRLCHMMLTYSGTYGVEQQRRR
eukprot:5576867-Amphidinium_carterae.3